MAKVLLKDVVQRIKDKVDKDNTELEYYIGGEHFDYGEICITKRGVIAGSTIGPAFHMQFKPGDVLLMSRNPHLRKAGVVDFEGICSDVSYVCRTKDENVLLQRYLPFIFQTDDFWDFAEQNKHGSTNFFLNWSDFEKYEFELPEIEEQKRLTELLWSAQDTKTAYQELLRQTDELVKSQFIEMFGLIGKDEKGWGITLLGECCELNPKRAKNISDNTLVTFVPMPNLSEDGHIDCSNIKSYKEVKKGFTYFEEKDVLFAKITPCMENGKGAVAEGLSNGIGAGSTELHILRPIKGKSNPYWLYIITMFEEFRVEARKNMTGTGGQLRVPIQYLADYPISLPPIDLQNQFEDFVRQTDKSKYIWHNALNANCVGGECYA